MDIKRTIWGAFGYVYEYRTPLAKALVIPVAILVVLGVIPVDESEMALKLLLNIMPIFIYTVIAITTHRIILLGPESTPEWGIYAPKKREFYFVMYSIGMGLLMIPFGLLSLIPTIGWLIAAIAIIYMMSRFSLVFPAIATDQNWSFSDSWNATHKHQLLMVTVVAIFPFLLSIPENLLSHVPYTGLVVNLLSAITMVFVVAALSVAFQVITTSGSKG